jgi:cell division septation protein DedD
MLPESSQAGGTEPFREFRLEGFTLWLAIVLLVALLGTAFWLGRWTAPAGGSSTSLISGADGRSGAIPAEPEEVPVEESLSFFDRERGQGQIAEPRRQAVPDSRPPRGTAERGSAPGVRTGSELPAGEWFVQVFAGRDRASAELVARQLREKGHPVRLDSEREGAGALYKVRVGGFATREAADRAAEGIRKEGSTGAWVTRVTD